MEVGTRSKLNHMTCALVKAKICKPAVFSQSLLGCFSRSEHFWPSLLGHVRDPDM